uniref:Ig-like domain-containing protein n=1 Tax=Oreochromis niloticus TaxID=8128 RepID=I3K5W9_ORENI
MKAGSPVSYLSPAGFTEGAGVLPDGPLNAAVGETVMFTTTLTPTEKPFQVVGWSFNKSKTIIISTNVNITGPEYEGRITFFPSTASLQLRSLTLNDSGEYIISILQADATNHQGRTTVVIYGEQMLKSNITSSSTDLVEFSGSVSLSCSASGSSLSFLWFNGSSEVTASDRVQLTDGGSSLTIITVTRSDQGPFRCSVSNPVSTGTSDPVNLSISYGPENINLILSPPQGYFAVGSDISLTCSVGSRPPAQFNWFLNGNQLPDTGSELRLMNVQMSQSGNYSCQAFNHKTLRSQTSQPSAITVLEKVSNVSVTSSSTDLVEFSGSVSLSCSASGSSLSFLWLNGSSEVTASDRVQLTDGGSSLTIITVTRFDQGPFRCSVSSPVSTGTSDPVNLSINGPEHMNLILSPPQGCFAVGSDISLTCSVGSRPPAQFNWFLNGDQLPDTGSELRLMNVQMSQSGNYSCQAFNSKTLRSQTSQPSTIAVLGKCNY